MSDIFVRLLGPRLRLTLDIEEGFVTGIWVAGRRPDIVIRDFDLGACDRNVARDAYGAPFIPINWTRPPWQLALALAPPHLFPF